MVKYFFRLDDVAPNMNWDNFNSVAEIFKNNDIRPLAAVIPDLKDPKLLGYSFNPNFWQLVTELKNSGWIIAQHGYQHLSNGGGGVLKIHNSGEFAGLSFENQKEMIHAGQRIMESQTFVPNIYFDLIRDLGGDLVEEVKLLDTYTDPKKFGDRVSYTYRVVYRSMDRTMTSEEIDMIQKNIYEQ